MNRLFLVFALGATLAGCAVPPAPGPAVTAPIPMSEKALEKYKAWMHTPYPAFFALSRDGQYAGAAFCKYHSDCGVTAATALSFCEYYAPRESGGCVIYAVDGRPVIEDRALAAAVGKTVR